MQEHKCLCPQTVEQFPPWLLCAKILFFSIKMMRLLQATLLMEHLKLYMNLKYLYNVTYSQLYTHTNLQILPAHRTMSHYIKKLVAKIPTEILQFITLKLGTKCLAIGIINHKKTHTTELL